MASEGATMVANAAVKISNGAKRVSKTLDINRAIDSGAYPLDTTLSLPQRGAHFLDWAAKNFPGQYVSYNMFLKAIMGFSKTPRIDGDAVEQLRGRMGRIREILKKNYGREVDSQRGVGARATVDDADTLKTSLPGKMKRLHSAKKAVVETVNLIDPANIPNTPDMKALKNWMVTDVRDIMKTLTSPSFEAKLLPPRPVDSK